MEKFIVKKSKRQRIELEESEEASHVSKVLPKTDITSENRGCDLSNPKNILTDKNQNVTLDSTKVKPPSDATLTRWRSNHAWLQLNSDNKVICTICSKAVEQRLPVPIGKNSQNSREAFVTVGYNCWTNAYRALPQHELSEFHRVCHQLLVSSEATSVVQHISAAKKTEMLNNRTALHKIFSTVQMMGVQGLPLRGSGNDERSNLTQFLKTRAEDVPELKKWLSRPGHKWVHHDIQNEMLDMMASRVRQKILETIRSEPFFSLTLDETSDISRLEQISMSIRIVSDDLSVGEIFLGFYKTSDTKSETLFSIVGDVFKESGLKFEKLRGQCYDGASNVSGRISGLQARIKEKQSRAVFVHCNAHRLNLSVQDAMESVSPVKNFIGVIKDLINFVRDSPKRLAQFQQFQTAVIVGEEDDCPALVAFCPTRWCMRVRSLKSIHCRTNYSAALHFFETRSTDREVDSSVSEKATGFLKNLESFEFYYLLTLVIELFDRIEILNKELQKSDLCIHDSHRKVEAVTKNLEQMRDSKFETIWDKAITGAKELDLDDPQLQRKRRDRRIPKRLENNGTNEPHTFRTPKDYYRKIYYEVFDTVVMSLKERFSIDTTEFLDNLEAFAIGRGGCSDEIMKFYQGDFDQEILVKHRDDFISIAAANSTILHNMKDVVTFMKANSWCTGLVPEYFRFIKLLLTIPSSTCTNERSFSALRRLKNYLRSTMLQDRLNNIAILHVHWEIAEALNIHEIMDEFIRKNVKRSAKFAIVKPNKTTEVQK